MVYRPGVLTRAINGWVSKRRARTDRLSSTFPPRIATLIHVLNLRRPYVAVLRERAENKRGLRRTQNGEWRRGNAWEKRV
jgi:hypothetical protein